MVAGEVHPRIGRQEVQSLGIVMLAEQPLVRAVLYLATSVWLSVYLYRRFEMQLKRVTRSWLMKVTNRDR